MEHHPYLLYITPTPDAQDFFALEAHHVQVLFAQLRQGWKLLAKADQLLIELEQGTMMPLRAEAMIEYGALERRDILWIRGFSVPGETGELLAPSPPLRADPGRRLTAPVRVPARNCLVPDGFLA